jgi:2Fe-2S ferredoxin
MTPFTLMPAAGTTLDIARGSTRLQAVRAVGGNCSGACGGASCGARRVLVSQGRKRLSRMTPVSKRRLDSMLGVGARSRLAGQASLCRASSRSPPHCWAPGRHGRQGRAERRPCQEPSVVRPAPTNPVAELLHHLPQPFIHP